VAIEQVLSAYEKALRLSVKEALKAFTIDAAKDPF
jgi:hypothetical protein